MPSQEASQAQATVAANIDRGITAKGWTNRKVGDAIGRTEHQVWRWRRGRNYPSLDVLVALAGVLFDGDMSEFHAEVREPDRTAA